MLDYFIKHTEKIEEKRGFCSRVRLGESMLGNRFLKTLQKPQKTTQKSKDSVISLLKCILRYRIGVIQSQQKYENMIQF